MHTSALFFQIRVYDTDIMSLSDADIAFEGLENQLEGFYGKKISKNPSWRFQWKQLKNLKKLRNFWMEGVRLGDITEPFPELQSLANLLMVGAKISFITKKAFHSLTNLEIFRIDGNDISKVERSMLPEPANSLKQIHLK